MGKQIIQEFDALCELSKAGNAASKGSITLPKEMADNLKDGDFIKVINQNNQIYMMVGGIALLTIIGTVAYYYYRQDKKKNKIISKQNVDIDKFKVDQEQFQFFKNKYDSFMQEENRKSEPKVIRVIKNKPRREKVGNITFIR